MQLAIIAHDIRSAHNIGSILRTCDGFGVQRVILSGYTPYPVLADDTRLPHIRDTLTRQIHKTALGAEQTVPCTHTETLEEAVAQLRKEDYVICALEQTKTALFLDELAAYWPSPPKKIALILGNEPSGLTEAQLALAHYEIEIRMFGSKESFNVSVAAGIALYELSKLAK